MAASLFMAAIFVLSYVFDAANGLSALITGSKNDVDVNVTALYLCKEQGSINARMDFKPEGVSIDTVLDTTVDNSYNAVVQLDQYLAVNQWKDNFFNYKGKLCDILDKFASRAWEKLRKLFQPPIPDKCKIEPGTYTVMNFQLPLSDVDIPSFFYGIYRLTLKINNPDDDLFFCATVEMETKKK